MLVLAFQTRSIRDVCESTTKATYMYGDAVASNLRHRLADLQAATSILDLPESIIKMLDDSTHLMIDLGEGNRILMASNHLNNPLLDSGEIDWHKVTRIKVLRIENYDT